MQTSQVSGEFLIEAEQIINKADSYIKICESEKNSLEEQRQKRIRLREKNTKKLTLKEQKYFTKMGNTLQTVEDNYEISVLRKSN